MTGTEQNIVSYIRNENLLEKGDHVLLALSGGADSTMLLTIFVKILVPILEIKVSAAHLNHSVRGNESDDDELFVKELCAQLRIPCLTKKTAINAGSGESWEEAARKIRYSFLEEASMQFKAGKIATAHHLDDQAETLLLRIFMGTGIAGLSGIAPRNGKIIRPLLKTRRSEIETYLANKGQTWRTDRTNADTSIPRNKIRHEIMPFLVANIGHHIPETLSRLADNCRSSPDKSTSAKLLADLLCNGFGFSGQLDNSAYNRLLKLAMAHTGSAPIGNGYIAVKSSGRISIRQEKDSLPAEIKSMLITLSPKDARYLLPDGSTVRISRKLREDTSTFPQAESGMAFLDADKTGNELLVRTRKSGDRFTPIGKAGTKKLSDFFVDIKLPREKRESTLLFCSGNDIVWVMGLRISNNYKITEKTKNVLIIETCI